MHVFTRVDTEISITIVVAGVVPVRYMTEESAKPCFFGHAHPIFLSDNE